MAEYYAQRRSAGLLVTEATTISEEANGWNQSPGIYTDEMTEGWKHTTNAVNDKGGVIFLQLWNSGRSSHSSFHGGKPSVAPSSIKINEPYIHAPIGKQPHEVPRALESSEIPRVVEDYRRAAELRGGGGRSRTRADAALAGTRPAAAPWPAPPPASRRRNGAGPLCPPSRCLQDQRPRRYWGRMAPSAERFPGIPPVATARRGNLKFAGTEALASYGFRGGPELRPDEQLHAGRPPIS
jgi:hypothetical protein